MGLAGHSAGQPRRSIDNCGRQPACRRHSQRDGSCGNQKILHGPELPDKSLKKFEALGFGPDAIEVQAFMLGLGVVAQLDMMIAKAEKRLMKFR